MPTTTVKTIGSGRDYSTLQAWEDACPANLVTNDEIWKGEVYKEGAGTNNEWTLASPLLISGQTTDATRYVWLAAASGQSFTDNGSKLTNALRYNSANGVAIATTDQDYAIDCSAANTRFTGLQVARRTTGGYAQSAMRSTAANALVEQCIVLMERGDRSTLTLYGGKVVNTLIHNNNNSASAIGLRPTNDLVEAINCTIIGDGGGTGVSPSYNSSHLLRNCAVFNWTTNVSNTGFFSGSSGFNATNAASIVGSSNQTSLTYSSQFQNTSTSTWDFRVNTSGVLDGNGTRDQTYTGDLDIVSQSRPTSGPSIGAWEGAPIVPVPNAPSGVTAGSITFSSASISWTDNSSDETGFRVRYAPSPYSSYTTATVSATSSPYVITGLPDGVSYIAGVAAANANGVSTYAESGVFTTTALTKLRPNADTTTGSWSASSGAVLYSMIDEANTDDADYITTSVNATCKIKLENGTDPASGANHVLRVRARGTGGTLRAELVQSATPETTIASWSITYTSSFGDFDLTLTTAQADAITDYSALYVKLISS